ncbi:ATP-grasp domain protein, partial [Vibrio parahaemolyticus V-223/04]
ITKLWLILLKLTTTERWPLSQ